MAVTPVSNNITALTELLRSNVETQASESSGDFSDILTKSIETATNTDLADNASGLQLVAGDVDDLAGILIDSEKAKIALSLTIQVRNKVLDAYDQIMNMQV